MRLFKGFWTLLILVVFSVTVRAEVTPIGYWQSYLPYKNAIGIATDGAKVFTATKLAFYVFNTADNSFTTYSKVDGMSDIGMQAIAYDPVSKSVILVYTNGNIDIYKDEIFYNVPDLKLKTVAGDKTVYKIFVDKGKAYLSTSLGIVVVDMADRSIEDTYQFYINNSLSPVTNFIEYKNKYYATVNNNLYSIDAYRPDIQNFQSWTKKDTIHNFVDLATIGSKLVLAADTSLYVWQGDTAYQFYAGKKLSVKLNEGNDTLMLIDYAVGTANWIKYFDTNLNLVDTFRVFDTVTQCIQLNNNSQWFAGYYLGLQKRTTNSWTDVVVPNGPSSEFCYDIYAYNRNVWVAHGYYDDKYNFGYSPNGMSNLKEDKWTLYNYDTKPQFFDSMRDIVSVVKDEADGTLYAASFTGGLVELKQDGTLTGYRKGSALDTSIANGAGYYQAAAVALDADKNLWITQYASYHQLLVREKATGNWYKYALALGGSNPYAGGQMAIDDAGNIWYVSYYNGGVVSYHTNGSLGNTSDDTYTQYNKGAGAGNLPSQSVYCIAKDKNDNIWVGTNDGIGIMYNASSCYEKCDFDIPVVKYDSFSGYFFAGEVVRTIAVDGGNRKWVGTDNGVWLLSPDAGNSKIINRFTTDNSPLPSNHIEKISIDPVTGDVYIGTELGLVSYRGTATEGGATHSNVTVFPNPISAGYKGEIAIKGLVANADVRITDVTGQLVYKTTAYGGQAVWNGYDYKGHRPQSGVYLIFSTNADGGQTYVGKMVFIQ